VLVSRFLLSLGLLVASGAALLWTSPVRGQDDASATDGRDEPLPHYAQPQSPALPAPKGLSYIDQGSHDRRLAGYRTPEGFKIEIVAESPTVANPVSITFAADGTPFILEYAPAAPADLREEEVAIKYKDGTNRRISVTRKKKKDVVKILSSSKSNGVFDQARVVLEDDSISGVLLLDGWLYLAGSGKVRRCKRSKSDGPFDRQEVIAQGFGGHLGRQVSGMTLGHDGWLHVTAGAGDHHVEGADGSRATVLRTGAIFRCRPDGSKLHALAIGFCNPHGNVAFDLGGNLFAIDGAVAEKSKFAGCRLMHVPDAADLGWRLAPGSSIRPDDLRGAVFGELPGKMPPLLKTGPGMPSGLFIYNDTRLPEDYRGLLYYPDPQRRLVRAYRVIPEKSSFKAAEEFKLLESQRDELFRPCGMAVGPDGAIYVVDRRAKSIGAGGMASEGSGGRIYRLTWTGTKEQPALALRGMDSWAKIGKFEDGELITTLSSDESSERERARQELVKRGDRNRKALIRLLDSDKALTARIAAVGVLQTMFDADVQTAFEKALKDGDSDLQRLAAEALGLCAKKGDRSAHNVLLEALASEDLSVRRAVALAMGRLAGPGAADNLAVALSFDQSKDVFLRDGLVRALESLGKSGIDALIALADSGVQKDTNRVVDAFLCLRSKAAFAALPTILKHMHVSSEQQVELVRSCTNYLLEPPVSLDPIVDFVASRPKTAPAVKKALLEVLAAPGVEQGAKAMDWAVAVATGKDDEAMQRDAVRVLGMTAKGARQAGQLLLDKKLPAGLLSQVTEALRKYADKDAEAAMLLKEVNRAGDGAAKGSRRS
jgi:putative membrane-bound dehydrogenase-like protein